MPVTKVPARDYTFEIDPAGGTAWVEIGGINTWSPNVTAEITDTRDFDSGGNPEGMKMSQGDVITLDGYRKSDLANGTRDPGQAACETLDAEFGVDSIGAFRMTDPDGEVKAFDCLVKVTSGGGGNDDVTKWSVEITRNGAVTVS